ncbi:MAG: T9SS type A sorting domain-containing protein [Flavobacteriales bacterium]
MKRILSIFAVVLIAQPLLAYKYVGNSGPGITDNTNGSTIQPQLRSAACAPATALRNIEWNNVKALIETGGSLWQDRAISQAAYEVPKGGGVSSLYAGALWMGGISPDQQLKLAALTFRNRGNDFWTGPLSNDGSAEIDASTCQQYDDFFVSTRSDAQLHRSYFDALANGTVDEEFPNGYVTPSYFFDYPAHGNSALNQDFYLGPFLDYDGNGFYDPAAGDYPWYDFLSEIDCGRRTREDIVPLYGDRNFYWIFNDKGNVHSESQGEPIGMEIRAQAFQFSTNDEVNNMTFHNYVLINQGTQTLGDTYFGVWVDADVGTATDDFVGCDVQRGLGYAYNGDAFDESSDSSPGYGENPPAVGIDFFEGPYQDADDVDNPLTSNFSDAVDSLGIPYSGIGIGYGDGVIDNERFGMRRFVYYNNSGSNLNGEPSTPLHYYNYMNGIWLNGQTMSPGGDGTSQSEISAHYMFPGDTDPYNWGTQGVDIEDWSEVGEGNAPADRRFIQSAGPFTLEPGDYNNITMGIVWARGTNGDPLQSVSLMRQADDKAQALFDNCFEIVSGPDAPDVTIQELENEVILYLTNDNALSNNFHEEYVMFDPGIPKMDIEGQEYDSLTRSFTFQGYQIYQLSDNTVSAADLENPAMARLIFQCDVADEIDVIFNYEEDEIIPVPVPVLKADGANEGISHSFRVTTDVFAQGDNKLVNHRTYYFMALAYGYNMYAPYVDGTGQDVPYKASRKGAVGSIRVYSGTPHLPSPEAYGTIQNSNYGDGVIVTRLEGKGNGDNVIELSSQSIDDILESPNGRVSQLTYTGDGSPVNIRVVDPLRVPDADFELRVNSSDSNLEDAIDSYWILTNHTLLDETGDSSKAVRTSTKALNILNEELLLDWGLSITLQQYQYPNGGSFSEPLKSSITYDNPSAPWLQGIPDSEGFDLLNWIRAGTQEGDADLEEEIVFNDIQAGNPLDEDEKYESILGGTWAPYCLVSFTDEVTLASGETMMIPNIAPTIKGLEGDLSSFSGINGLNNVDVVLTSDKSLWTRCPVLEMQPVEELSQKAYDGDDPEKMRLRRHPSVDKKGRKPSDVGYNASEANPSGNQPVGMSWFPGYAIDVGTGERLNMAFGEDSWLGADNGNDMIFNPSSRIYSGSGNQGGFIQSGTYAGGQHWIYIFKNSQFEEGSSNRMPSYDKGDYLYQNLEADPSTTTIRRVFRACTWVGSTLSNEDFPMLSVEDGLVPNRAHIKLRVSKSYEKYSPLVADVDETELSENNWNPLYTFSTNSVATITADDSTLISVLDAIGVVPNPYYAYSKYETSKLDNRVKITNVPEVCTISIYNLSGTLVRQFQKADPLTFQDWDLKNNNNVPIAGGVYIIHIDVPEIGKQKILKWFGVMRPIDLDTF